MYIIIDNKNNKYNTAFVRYLLMKLQGLYSKNANIDKLKVIEDYFNSNVCDIFDKESKPVNILKIVSIILASFEIKTFQNKYILKLNKFNTYKGVNICLLNKIINNGNLTIKGYPLLKEITQFINDNIDKYYQKYIFMVH